MDNQDNGGGLDVVPRSYLRDDPAAIALHRETGLREGHIREPEGDPYAEAVTLRTKAGDATIFHLRTSHRASIASKAERKLAIFMVVGPNNASTFRYRTWLDEKYAKMNDTTRPAVPQHFRSFLADLELSVI